MLSYKMDFSFCACKLGFVKSSHNYTCFVHGIPGKSLMMKNNKLQLHYVILIADY